MRFEIGQQVPFIKVKFHDKPEAIPTFQRLFDPRVHELDSIEVKMLTVKEHHKVPSCYDIYGEKKYDGFIFTEQTTDGKEQVWNNQYPTATYGQISDECDRMVVKNHTHSKDDLQQMSGMDLDALFEQWFTALHFIANIKRAIDGGEKYSIHLSDEDKVPFYKYLNEVQKAIEKVSGKNVVFATSILEFNDGSVKELDGYWVAKLV